MGAARLTLRECVWYFQVRNIACHPLQLHKEHFYAMTDQFSRDHYRDSRQPGENSSRRRVDANPNHRTAGDNARHASSNGRPAGTRQQTGAHQQGAPRPRASSAELGARPAAPPLAESSPANAARCACAQSRQLIGRIALCPRDDDPRPEIALARRRTRNNRPTPPSTTTTPATPSAARSAPVLLPSALWRCSSSPSALACSSF